MCCPIIVGFSLNTLERATMKAAMSGFLLKMEFFNRRGGAGGGWSLELIRVIRDPDKDCIVMA